SADSEQIRLPSEADHFGPDQKRDVDKVHGLSREVLFKSTAVPPAVGFRPNDRDEVAQQLHRIVMSQRSRPDMSIHKRHFQCPILWGLALSRHLHVRISEA